MGLQSTCTSIGYNIRTCSLCGGKDYEFTQATGHEWDNGRTVFYENCTEDGLKLYACTKCDLTKSEIREHLGHLYEDDKCIICGELQPSEGMAYTLNKDRTGYIAFDMTDEEVAGKFIIAKTYNGLPVTEVRGSAFYKCVNITEIVMQDGVQIISTPFVCRNLRSIYFPASLTEIKTASPFVYCENLESIIVDEKNTVYKSSGNCMIEIQSKKIVAGCKNSVIPDDGSVEIIGRQAFWGNGIESITIPQSVVAIEDSVFVNCKSLTEVVINEGVKTIGQNVFKGCINLESVTLPESLEALGDEAFSGCHNLTSINYNGTIEQWDAIQKTSYWNSNSGNYTIHCTDGDISKSDS